jgi:sphingosine kinase
MDLVPIILAMEPGRLSEETAAATEPLLLSGSNDPIFSCSMGLADMTTDESVWPSSAASKLRFEIPESWRDVRKDNRESFCQIRYDPERRLLHIVHWINNEDTINADNATVLDTIDVDDMIGADLQIELLSAGGRRNEETNVTNGSQESNNRASNEPATDEVRDTQGKAILSLYVYPRVDPSSLSICNKLNITTYRPPLRTPNYQRPESHNTVPHPRIANHRRFVVAASEDLHDARAVVAALRTLARHPDNNRSSIQKYRIIVNPNSGPKRNAVKIAQDIVIPMLRDQAGIETTLEITTHPGHAGELVQDENQATEPSDGIIVMGGDGILHEALNGFHSPHSIPIPIGIIGCGTSNGLASSLTHAANEANGILQDVFLIAKGHTIPADLATMQVKRKRDGQVQTYTSFLTYSWGIIADIDLESECLRFLGESRLDLWAVWRVIWKRTHRAKFSYTNDKMDTLPDFSDPLSSWTTIYDDIVLFWTALVTHVSVQSIVWHRMFL